MTTETKPTEHTMTKVIHQGGASEAVYGFGLIGAWIYYFTHAATFWIGVLGFFKGIVWPAMLVYDVLKYLHL
jgi:hypothetical protein